MQSLFVSIIICAFFSLHNEIQYYREQELFTCGFARPSCNLQTCIFLPTLVDIQNH